MTINEPPGVQFPFYKSKFLLRHECQNKNLVSQEGLTWNTLYPKLVELSEKLEELGLVEVNGQIAYIDDKEAENV